MPSGEHSMEQITLKLTKRDELGSLNSRRLRRTGKIPGIVYGHKQQCVPVTVDADELNNLVDTGARMLNIDLDGTTESVMVRNVQFDTFGEKPLHVDFSRVAMDEQIHIEVNIEFHGEPVGVRDGGNLDLGIHQVNIACLPADVPEAIRAELSELNIGDTFHVRDLDVPPGVQFLTPGDAVVANVRPPVAEEPAAEEEALEEGEAAEGATAEDESDEAKG